MSRQSIENEKVIITLYHKIVTQVFKQKSLKLPNTIRNALSFVNRNNPNYPNDLANLYPIHIPEPGPNRILEPYFFVPWDRPPDYATAMANSFPAPGYNPAHNAGRHPVQSTGAETRCDNPVQNSQFYQNIDSEEADKDNVQTSDSAEIPQGPLRSSEVRNVTITSEEIVNETATREEIADARSQENETRIETRIEIHTVEDFPPAYCEVASSSNQS